MFRRAPWKSERRLAVRSAGLPFAACLSVVIGCAGRGLHPGGEGGTAALDAASERVTDGTGGTPVGGRDASADDLDAIDAADVHPEAPADGRPVCAPPKPDICNFACVDVQSDPANCGGCGHPCSLPHAMAGCSQGQCTLVACEDSTWADCTADPGCETRLGATDDCAACGDQLCALANTLMTCQSADACTRAVCTPGFGNCESASSDCETGFEAGGSCFPRYLGTTPLPTQDYPYVQAAIGPDGSVFVTGAFRGTLDFDLTGGHDIRSTGGAAGALAPFIVKINADGSYGWTRTFSGDAVSMGDPVVAADGAVVAVGVFAGSVDLDPGPGVDLHQTTGLSEAEGLVVKLAADGSFVWGRTFQGVANGGSYSNLGGAAIDADDSVYVAGIFRSTVDFDPGPGTALRMSATGSSFLTSAMIVKLNSVGEFAWVQTIDDAQCGAALGSLAVATDGTIWGVGAHPMCLGPPRSDPLIAAYSPEGTSRGTWRISAGRSRIFTSTIAAGASGSIYIGGEATGSVDLDPGPGVAMRWAGRSSSAFVVKLASDATFLWGQTLPGVDPGGIAAAADAGVLVAGTASRALVSKLGPDGTPSWTFATGGQTGSAGATVVARGSSVVVVGFSHGSGDFDPGPNMDIVAGDILFLSRFSF